MSYIAAGVGVASLAYGVYNAESQKSKANKIQKGLHDPVYQIPQEFYQNREIARQMAQQGLPQSVINQQNDRINQNQAAAIEASSRSSNPGGLAAVVRQGDDAGATLGAEDAQAKLNNQRFFIQMNKELGNQELDKQQSDVFDKYTREFNQAAALQGAGMQNENTVVQDAGQMAMTAYAYRKPKSTLTTGAQAPVAAAGGVPEQYWNIPGYFPNQQNPDVNLGFGTLAPGYQEFDDQNFQPNYMRR